MSEPIDHTQENHTEKERGKSNPNTKRASAAALIDAFAHQYQVDREETGRREKHRIFREWLTIIGLFIAAVVAFFQWRELRSTDHNIAEQAKIAERQLTAMQGQLSAMEADQRPWVFATNIVISRPLVRDEKGLNIALRFDLKNGGKSPALQTSVGFKAYLTSVQYREEEKIICGNQAGGGLGEVLFQDNVTSQETGWLIPAAEIIAAQKLGSIAPPFVVACISYRSPRSNEIHSTPYEFLIGLPVGSSKWPCCKFPFDEPVIQPSDLQLTKIPVSEVK